MGRKGDKKKKNDKKNKNKSGREKKGRRRARARMKGRASRIRMGRRGIRRRMGTRTRVAAVARALTCCLTLFTTSSGALTWPWNRHLRGVLKPNSITEKDRAP